MTPEVSVIMAVYNGMPYLPAAVESILGQTLRAIEFVVIDDGSRDGSGAWLDARATTDERLRVIHQANRGLAASLNRAIEEARAPLLARMDADDVSEPERLERQVAFIGAHPEIVLLGTRATVTDVEGRALWVAPSPTEDAAIREALRTTSPFFHGSVMYRRADVDAAGRYDDVRSIEDIFLFQRLSRRGALRMLAEPLYRYRLSPLAASVLPDAVNDLLHEIAPRTWPGGQLSEADRARVQAADGRVSPSHRRMQYFIRIGKGLFYYRSDRAGATVAFLRAIAARPWDPEAWLRLGLVLAPRWLINRARRALA